MNDKKQIFGWAMYDWANSAYVTTVAVAVFPLFFRKVIVPENGFTIGGVQFSAISLLAFMSSFCSFLIFLCAPILGAISDFSASKKKFLMVFCYGGSLFSILLYFCGTGDVWLAMIFFVISQIGFIGGNIFYDGFLPQIASEDKLDRVSGKGYAYGYIGGGLQFALSLGLIARYDFFGFTYDFAAKLAMVMAGYYFYLSEGNRHIRTTTGRIPKIVEIVGIFENRHRQNTCNRQKSCPFQAPAIVSHSLHDLQRCNSDSY